MNTRKRGLGRGLEALLVDVSPKEEKHQLQILPIDNLKKIDQCPQDDINSDKFQELANTITLSDNFEPVVVRKIAENNYEIVSGESRWRAARLAGLQEMPVIIKVMNDRDSIAIGLTETIQKESFNLLQEAKNLKLLIDEFEAMVRHL